MTITLPPYEYLKGEDFNNNLLKALNKRTLRKLGADLNVPYSTFSTWRTHNRAGFELIVRIHLATGISIQALALGQFNEVDNELSRREFSTPMPSFEYLSGADFTQAIKKCTGCKTHQELLDFCGIPKSTFSTWNTHKRTGFELMVRVLLGGLATADMFIVGGEEIKVNLPASVPKRPTEQEIDMIMQFAEMDDKKIGRALIETLLAGMIKKRI